MHSLQQFCKVAFFCRCRCFFVVFFWLICRFFVVWLSIKVISVVQRLRFIWRWTNRSWVGVFVRPDRLLPFSVRCGTSSLWWIWWIGTGETWWIGISIRYRERVEQWMIAGEILLRWLRWPTDLEKGALSVDLSFSHPFRHVCSAKTWNTNFWLTFRSLGIFFLTQNQRVYSLGMGYEPGDLRKKIP